VIGDLVAEWPLQRWGALGNGVAIVLFLASVVRAVVRDRRARRVAAAVASPTAVCAALAVET
jgi:hypothetical protein